MKTIKCSSVLTLLLLGACSWRSDPTPTIDTPTVERPALPRPEAITTRPVDWQVLSVEDRAAALRALHAEQALLCLTPEDYENLTHNTAEARRWVQQMIRLVEEHERE